MRKECTKHVTTIVTKAKEEPGAMKMNNFKKKYKYATADKGKTRSKPKLDERKQQEEKIGDKSMSESLTAVNQMKEKITHADERIVLLCEKKKK